KSSWDDPGLADHERPLAARGIRNAATLADHIRAAGVAPGLVLCSTAVRARETLAAILGALAGELVVAIQSDLYGAPASSLLASRRGVRAGVESGRPVGHNPGLEELAVLLAGEEAPGRMPPAALVALSTESAWPALAERTCHVEAVTVPR